MNEPPMTTGERIRTRRANIGLTLNALADTAKVSKAALHDIENKSTVRVSADVLYLLARALGCTMEDLMGVESLKRQNVKRATDLAAENAGLRKRLQKIAAAVEGL